MVERKRPQENRGKSVGSREAGFGSTIKNPKAVIEQKTLPVPGSGQQENGECAHHWMLGGQHDSVSIGTCKLCGATREFIGQDGGIEISKYNRSRNKSLRKPKDAVEVKNETEPDQP